MTDTTTTSTTKTADPWWKHPENWTAIMTVGSLVLTALGYTLTAEDMHTLVVSGGGIAAGTIQIVGVFRRVLASKQAV